MENLALFDERPRGDVLRMGARACVLRGFALPHVRVSPRDRRHRTGIRVPAHGHARRLHHVRRHDELRRAWMTNDRRGYRYTYWVASAST